MLNILIINIMNSKQIENMVQPIEAWAYQKYGTCAPDIYIEPNEYEEDQYDIKLEYDDDNRHIEEEIVCGLTGDELTHYVCDGELKADIDRTMKSQEQANMELMMIAVNRFQFHAWNYPYAKEAYECPNGKRYTLPRFLMEVDWNCSRDHMISKWFHAVRDNESDAYMPRFYAELSSDNRQRLIEWVIKHYTDEQKFSFQRLNSED